MGNDAGELMRDGEVIDPSGLLDDEAVEAMLQLAERHLEAAGSLCSAANGIYSELWLDQGEASGPNPAIGGAMAKANHALVGVVRARLQAERAMEGFYNDDDAGA